MSDLETLVDTYCRAWFDPDLAKRRQLLFQSVEPEVTYVDPSVQIAGFEMLASHIEKTRETRPGFWLERTTLVDSHHNFIRFGWVQRRGSSFRGDESIDVCQLSPDGKMLSIIGFFGPLIPNPMSDKWGPAQRP